ncbi:MAG TPA: medium chain dehydrogenase/reductase family protein [Mycobacteriales bacterium]|nr:medium chain dehydrogenase/reductase family protein [Mycobacteriales bacterium]
MRSVQVHAVSRARGSDSLVVRVTDIPEPTAGQARVRIAAAGVSYGDLLFQRGVVPGGPKPPFVPGCDLTGVVESVGPGVAGVEPGDRVTALVVSAGYSSVLNVPVERLVPVPADLDPIQVAAVSLNYFIAYQMLHRIAQVRSGQRILVHGASGGVGLALLQLAEQIGDVQVWGTSSARNLELVGKFGATPIDYRAENVFEVVKAAGGSVDAVFDHIGGTHFWRSYTVLRRGGRLVAYGQNDALRDGRPNMRVGAIGFLGGILAPKLIPDGRRTGFYNAWALEKSHPTAYRDDLTHVLTLLAAGRVAPRSITVLPLREADMAFRTLEEGVTGKIVLDTSA